MSRMGSLLWSDLPVLRADVEDEQFAAAGFILQVLSSVGRCEVSQLE